MTDFEAACLILAQLTGVIALFCFAVRVRLTLMVVMLAIGLMALGSLAIRNGWSPWVVFLLGVFALSGPVAIAATILKKWEG